MKLLFFVLYCLISVQAQDTWTWLNPVPQGRDLYSGAILEDGSMLAGGDAGTLLRSTDAGTNWSFVNLPVKQTIRSISASGNTVYAAADSGIVYYSFTAGSSFNFVVLPERSEVRAVIKTGTVVYIFTGNGKIFRTDSLLSSPVLIPSSPFSGISSVLYSEGKLYAAQGDTVFSSADNAASWSRTVLGFGNTINALATPGRGVIFAGGMSGKIFRSTDAGQQWVLCSGQGTSWIKSISFSGADKGIAVGANNQIMLTTNGGDTWIKQKAAGEILLNCISTSSGGAALIAGERGLISVSTDFGATWKVNISDPNLRINDICFVNATIGWAVGNNGLLLTTTDGGAHWQQLPALTQSNLNAVRFLDSLNGWGMGDRASIVRTYDGGVNWELGALATSSSYDFYDFSYLRLMARAVGKGGAVFESYNFGKNWQPSISAPTIDDLYGYAAMDERYGTAVGQNGKMYFIYRYFGGTVYDNISLNTNENLMSICYVNKHGFVAGQYGIILKTTDGAHFKRIANLNVPVLNSIAFYDTLNGYTGGSAGRLFKTANSGASWEIVPTGITNTIRKVFIKDGKVWLLCSNSVLLSSQLPASLPASAEEKNSSAGEEGISIFPQPVKAGEALTMMSTLRETVQAELYEITGRKLPGTDYLVHSGNTALTIPRSVSAGVYLLKIHGKSGVFIRKVLIK